LDELDGKVHRTLITAHENMLKNNMRIFCRSHNNDAHMYVALTNDLPRPIPESRGRSAGARLYTTGSLYKMMTSKPREKTTHITVRA